MLPFAQEFRVFMPKHRAFSVFRKVVTQQHDYLFVISNKLILLTALVTAYFQSVFTEDKDICRGDGQRCFGVGLTSNRMLAKSKAYCFNSFCTSDICTQRKTLWVCQQDQFFLIFRKCFGGSEGETFKVITGRKRKDFTPCRSRHCQHPETFQI